jgi:hypothetical protein
MVRDVRRQSPSDATGRWVRLAYGLEMLMRMPEGSIGCEMGRGGHTRGWSSSEGNHDTGSTAMIVNQLVGTESTVSRVAGWSESWNGDGRMRVFT